MVNMLAHSPHAVPEYPSVRDEVTDMEQVDIACTTVLMTNNHSNGFPSLKSEHSSSKITFFFSLI